MPPDLLTKTQFAKHMGVARSAVSKWIERGTISDEAIVGEGRKAKINVTVAVEQVRQNRDIGQALGNGIATKTTVDVASTTVRDRPEHKAMDQPELTIDAPFPPVPSVEIEDAPRKISVEEQIKEAKLEAQLRSNRMQASEEAVRQGLLIANDDARKEMADIATMMLQIFEGSLPSLAAEVAARFGLPQRDVLHLLRAEFKKVRATAAKKEKQRTTETNKVRLASVGVE